MVWQLFSPSSRSRAWTRDAPQPASPIYITDQTYIPIFQRPQRIDIAHRLITHSLSINIIINPNSPWPSSASDASTTRHFQFPASAPYPHQKRNRPPHFHRVSMDRWMLMLIYHHGTVVGTLRAQVESRAATGAIAHVNDFAITALTSDPYMVRLIVDEHE